MFPLDNPPFLTDTLDGIEDSDPDTGRNHGKGSDPGVLLDDKHIRARHSSQNYGDHNGKDQELPVLLMKENPKQLSNVNPSLSDPAGSLFHRCHFLSSSILQTSQ